MNLSSRGWLLFLVAIIKIVAAHVGFLSPQTCITSTSPTHGTTQQDQSANVTEIYANGTLFDPWMVVPSDARTNLVDTTLTRFPSTYSLSISAAPFETISLISALPPGINLTSITATVLDIWLSDTSSILTRGAVFLKDYDTGVSSNKITLANLYGSQGSPTARVLGPTDDGWVRLQVNLAMLSQKQTTWNSIVFTDVSGRGFDANFDSISLLQVDLLANGGGGNTTTAPFPSPPASTNQALLLIPASVNSALVPLYGNADVAIATATTPNPPANVIARLLPGVSSSDIQALCTELESIGSGRFDGKCTSPVVAGTHHTKLPFLSLTVRSEADLKAMRASLGGMIEYFDRDKRVVSISSFFGKAPTTQAGDEKKKRFHHRFLVVEDASESHHNETTLISSVYGSGTADNDTLAAIGDIANVVLSPLHPLLLQHQNGDVEQVHAPPETPMLAKKNDLEVVAMTADVIRTVLAPLSNLTTTQHEPHPSTPTPTHANDTINTVKDVINTVFSPFYTARSHDNTTINTAGLKKNDSEVVAFAAGVIRTVLAPLSNSTALAQHSNNNTTITTKSDNISLDPDASVKESIQAVINTVLSPFFLNASSFHHSSPHAPPHSLSGDKIPVAAPTTTTLLPDEATVQSIKDVVSVVLSPLVPFTTTHLAGQPDVNMTDNATMQAITDVISVVLRPWMEMKNATTHGTEVSVASVNTNAGSFDGTFDSNCSSVSWNLDRISQPLPPLDGQYDPRFYPATKGQGVHIYVLDTGVDPTHPAFASRISTAADCTLPNATACVTTTHITDENGHGTHVSGLALGECVGVAPGATLYPVKVLNPDGTGSFSTIIKGLQWVVRDVEGSKNLTHRPVPAVVLLSLGGDRSKSMDDAVTETVQGAGIPVVVAAGNGYGADACTTSPSGAPAALVVGATDRSDKVAPFSDAGPCVDVWAPGTGILSAWVGGGEKVLQGTSQAAPQVAGALALALSQQVAGGGGGGRDGGQAVKDLLSHVSVLKDTTRGGLLQV